MPFVREGGTLRAFPVGEPVSLAETGTSRAPLRGKIPSACGGQKGISFQESSRNSGHRRALRRFRCAAAGKARSAETETSVHGAIQNRTYAIWCRGPGFRPVSLHCHPRWMYRYAVFQLGHTCCKGAGRFRVQDQLGRRRLRPVEGSRTGNVLLRWTAAEGGGPFLRIPFLLR